MDYNGVTPIRGGKVHQHLGKMNRNEWREWNATLCGQEVTWDWKCTVDFVNCKACLALGATSQRVASPQDLTKSQATTSFTI